MPVFKEATGRNEAALVPDGIPHGAVFKYFFAAGIQEKLPLAFDFLQGVQHFRYGTPGIFFQFEAVVVGNYWPLRIRHPDLVPGRVEVDIQFAAGFQSRAGI